MKCKRGATLTLVAALITGSSSLRAQQAPAPVADSPAAASELPMPPKVVCKGDQLSIEAANSTLASVLAEVRRCTGARVDLAEGASSSRVFDKLGPGAPRQILEALLGDSGFDFVIGSAVSNPDKVESILLLARNNELPTGLAPRSATPARQAFLQMREVARPKNPTAQQDVAAALSTGFADYPQPEPASVIPSAEPPTPVSKASLSAGLDAAASNDGNPAPSTAPRPSAGNLPSTTEDQIANMQQLFERRRQMMQSKP